MTQLQLELEPRPAARPLPAGDNELARAVLWAREWVAHKRGTGWYSKFMALHFPPPNVMTRRSAHA